jgi:phage terminase small subunit
MGAVATQFELTELQEQFVKYTSEGLEPTRAVELAGYSAKNASVEAWRLLRLPHVLAAIRFEVSRKLVALAPIALATIEGIVKDTTAPAKIRLDGAKTLLDRAGHIAPRAIADKSGVDLALNEMSISDLRNLADKLESELATRAKPANSANSDTRDAQAIDMLA